MDTNKVYDTIIIGGGIAGLSAALYSARQKLSTLVLSKDLGGQLTLTDLIENYPGIESIGGRGLSQKIYTQAKRFNAEFVLGEEVKEISQEGEIFIVNGIHNVYQSKTIVLAFGKTPRELNVPGEQEFKGKGVSYCAICDAAFFKGKPAMVVGEGEPGLEAIEILSKHANPAYYVTSSGQLSGDEELIKKIMSTSNIKIYTSSKVLQINGNGKVEEVVINKGGETLRLKVEGVIIEMGYVLKTDFLRGFLKLNDKGEVIVDEFGRTSREGVFAAGDVTQTPYKQAVIAAAEGVKAALSAYNYLRSKRGLGPITVDWKAEKKKISLKLS
ncbi:NAD(P)/FAD-dependent oxidoreductase [Sulfolobus acidocaldarius]|uniref:Thioredoxin reductase n=4 Tax=Sulfolobus acidocaldarius TaxID=2285 RepID=Q4J9L4_SULAC|nr:FAD-dependent oxidoreductase [Sulfolobus acidocaldarius]AAY80516.1 thioredoxin reductase [Sulfolobus acidocaldarius DSM 639]AGE71105.1 thioredoxin reductase [Sulfolobus acidocaldarius N8]AGE73376.1 thioredoxin reductase [Sulfolobus acidocaldarius Ron12/I]ALU28620.1 thioredoxin reductase [Sulfolobus acidocaldarius]ALU31334.1 thioredoxin reductase [Sulfolobus acidocaldarius]